MHTGTHAEIGRPVPHPEPKVRTWTSCRRHESLGWNQRASRLTAAIYFAISLSVPFMVEIKCVTVASLETNVDVERNGEISAQLAFWLTDLGELKA